MLTWEKFFCGNKKTPTSMLNSREGRNALYITVSASYYSIFMTQYQWIARAREIQQVQKPFRGGKEEKKKFRISLYGSFLPLGLCFLQWNYFSPVGNYDA
jgi:hypothetical protein